MKWKYCPWCGCEVAWNFKVRREVVRVYPNVSHDCENKMIVYTSDLFAKQMTDGTKGKDNETYESIEIECTQCDARWEGELKDRGIMHQMEIVIKGEL